MNRPAPAAAPDPLEAAIAAAERPAPVRMGQVELTLSSGRVAHLAVPLDATDAELLDIVSALSVQVRQAAASTRASDPRNRIVLP